MKDHPFFNGIDFNNLNNFPVPITDEVREKIKNSKKQPAKIEEIKGNKKEEFKIDKVQIA